LVVDPATRVLYAAQEDIGLWRLPIVGSRFAGPARSVEHTREFGVPATYDAEEDECTVDYTADPGFGGRIAADVEGLAIYQGRLVVSSQGDGTFYTYDRFTDRPRDHFAVVDSSTVDGVSACDGAAVVRTPLPGYPRGLLVVHDGENTPDEPDGSGEPRPNTNFKYLDAGFLAR
jgi:3-phytase